MGRLIFNLNYIVLELQPILWPILVPLKGLTGIIFMILLVMYDMLRMELYDAIKLFHRLVGNFINKLPDKATNTTSNKFKRNFYKGLMYVIFVIIAYTNTLRSFFKPLKYKHTSISEAFFSLPNLLILILGAEISLGLYLNLTGIFLTQPLLGYSLFFLSLDINGARYAEFFIKNKEMPFCQSYYEWIARFALRSQQYRYGLVRYVFTGIAARSVNFLLKPTKATLVGVTGIAVITCLTVYTLIDDYWARQRLTEETDREVQIARDLMAQEVAQERDRMAQELDRWAQELEQLKQELENKKQ
jgi:signal transduction histidine kinase